MNDKDRIRLAEAMGWRRVSPNDQAWWPAPYIIERLKERYPDVIAFDYVGLDSLPDPFTDANDDYAVLEWMRGKGRKNEQFTQFAFRCNIHWMDDWTLYKIGDYARAALADEPEQSND